MEVFERRLKMKSATVLSFALLSALSFGSIAPAQSASQQQNQLTTILLPAVSSGCPVSLHAQHGADGNMLNVDKGRPKGLAQLLRLTLTNPDSRQIVQANVRVHGLSGKGRVAQATSAQKNSGQDNSDKVESMVVSFSPGQNKSVSGDLWVPGMTAVLSIDLNSVTFADGSTTSFSGRDLCHVAPDPLMLIAGR